MTIGQFLLFAALEIILLVGLYVLYVLIKRIRDKKPSAAQGGTEPALTVDHYAQLLQAQILDAESHLKQLEQNEPIDELAAGPVRARLELLKCERKVVDNSGVDPLKLWTSVADWYAAWVPDKEAGGASESETGGEQAIAAALQEKLDACRQRIANLEKFRGMFFDIKLNLEAKQSLGQRLHDEVDKAVPKEAQSPELCGAMDELKAENETMLQQLQHIQHEFSEIIQDLGEQESTLSSDSGISALANMDNIKGNLSGSFEHLDEGVEQIRQVMVVQEQRIHELHDLVEGLQLEVADKQRIQACIDEVNNKNSELTEVITILEGENTFLQEQISALLKQELVREEEIKAELAQHKQQLEEHASANTTLEKKYADMEQKYLDLYSEYQDSKR